MIYVASAESYLRQLTAAHEEVANLDAYARSIGCTVVQDEVTCHTTEQSELLDKYTARMFATKGPATP